MHTQSAPQHLVAMDFTAEYDLIETGGQNLSSRDLAGLYQIVFFGFTHCPDICPTELQRMSVVYNLLSEERQDKLQMIFISVDPERDDQAAMLDYMSNFDPAIRGLTGTPEKIEMAAKNFKAYFKKSVQADNPQYTVDHTALWYLVGPDGKAIGVFKPEATAEQIAQDLSRLIR